MPGKTKILLVDDEKRFRETWHRRLTSRGYDVIIAENGQIALDILSNSQVNIIILERKISLISGEDTLEIVNTKYPNIPIIIITGHRSLDIAMACMKKGAYDFIAKPFEVDQLLLAIERAEDKKKLEQKAKQTQDELIRTLFDFNTEKKRLKTIINCLANGVMLTNRNLEVILHNPSLMRLLEISERIENPFPVSYTHLRAHET